jgi:hypothetical protein
MRALLPLLLLALAPPLASAGPVDEGFAALWQGVVDGSAPPDQTGWLAWGVDQGGHWAAGSEDMATGAWDATWGHLHLPFQ